MIAWFKRLARWLVGPLAAVVVAVLVLVPVTLTIAPGVASASGTACNQYNIPSSAYVQSCFSVQGYQQYVTDASGIIKNPTAYTEVFAFNVTMVYSGGAFIAWQESITVPAYSHVDWLAVFGDCFPPGQMYAQGTDIYDTAIATGNSLSIHAGSDGGLC